MNEPSAGGSRREFLKTSAIAAGAAASLSIARSAHGAGVDDAVRIALIGCGGRGSGAVRDALSSGGNVRIVALADAFEDRLNGAKKNILEHAEQNDQADRVDLPEERCFVGFDAYKQAIASDIDMVILATPPGFRPIHFEAAVNAGKHVFMEKPVAVDAPGVRKVLAAAEKAKAKSLAVGVGLQRRHQKPYLEIVDKLHNGAIGDIQYMRVYWNGNTPWVRERQVGQTEMEYQMRNWYFFNWLCGDHITEQHIHNLDVANWVLGGFPVKANGMGGRQVRVGPDFGEIYDHHFVEFEYEGGVNVYSQCRHQGGAWNSVTEFAHGTKGWSEVGNRIVGENAFRSRGGTNPYVQEHTDLYAAIAAGTPYNEAEYGAKSTMTSIMGRMATYGGKVVTWDEVINSDIDLSPDEYAWDAKPKVLPGPDGMYACAIPGVTQVV